LSAGDAAGYREGLPLKLRPCGMCVSVTVNDRDKQWVRLDTGCVSALQWVTANIRPEDCSRQPAVAVTALSIPQTETTVKIGPYQFQHVATGIHQKPIFMGESGLLGNGLISRFSRITIDAKARRLLLAP